jgi:hypothetical protein
MTTTKKLLLVLVATAGLADLATFVFFNNEAGGVANELNPVMRAAYDWLGLAAIAYLKIGLIVVLVFLVSRVHRPRMLALAAGVAIAFGLLGALGNIRAFLL